MAMVPFALKGQCQHCIGPQLCHTESMLTCRRLASLIRYRFVNFLHFRTQQHLICQQDRILLGWTLGPIEDVAMFIRLVRSGLLLFVPL